MKKTIKIYLMAMISLIAMLSMNAFAAAWTGSTSEPENMKKIDGKPFYVITTADELAWFAAQVNAGNASINAVLGNDIVFGADKNARSSAQWTPIGNDTEHPFAGILDGAGYTIYGIYVNGIPIAGIVGVLQTGGVVRNLKTNSGYIRGNSRVGGFVANNEGVIHSVENNNQIEASYKSGSGNSIYIGGIVGHNNGTIATSSNKASISNQAPTAFTGGIAGMNSGKIEDSKNTGSVSATSSYQSGDAVYTGGIAGYNTGSINRTKNDGAISADGTYFYSATGSSASGNSNCTYQGTDYTSHYSCKAYKNTYVGGIVGYSTIIVDNSVNGGKTTNSNSKNRYINGIVASGTAKNSMDLLSLKYWLNGTEVQGTAENMQKDQFAWILNTTNGTEENSGVWTRGSEGYPTFANEDSLAIRKIVFNDDGVTSNRYTNYKGIVSFPEDPEPAEGLVFSGWFNADDIRVKPTTVFVADQTVNAVYVDASDVFWTINFYNAAPADTLLESKSYQHGSIVTYGGETPTKEQTAQYSYTFKGWDVDPTNAFEDFDYHAVYDSTIRSYTVVFNNYDGTEIESGTYEYGKIPACSLIPTRAATAEWTYSHKGWDPAVDVVTGSATYTATFDSSKVEYKVTFMNGTIVIDEQMVHYGDAAVAPTNVSREGYKFVGWNISFAKVTENLTVKALFEELPTYFVKIVDDGGVKIDSVNIKEGGVYFLPEPETREGYAFAGYFNEGMGFILAGEGITVTTDIVITAFYAEIPKSSSSSTPKSSSSSVRSSSSAKSSSSSAKSSSSVRSSSSSKVMSSSSSKPTNVIAALQIPHFTIQVASRSIQISAAPIGSSYAIFDMQGRVLKQGQIDSVNFNIAMPIAGNYLVKVGNRTQRISVK